MSIQVRVPESKIAISSVTGLELREECNRHTYVKAQIVSFDPARTVFGALGKILEVSFDAEQRFAFKGIIAKIEVVSDQFLLTAYGASYQHDLISRTRSFDSESPKAISGFDEIKKIFPKVEGFELLSVTSSHVSQFGETDWRMLVRLAQLSGAYVVTKSGKLRVVSLEKHTNKTELGDDQIVDHRASIQLGSSAVETTTWDWEAGSAPNAAIVKNRESDQNSIEGMTRAATEGLLPGGARHRLFPFSDIADDELQTKRWSSHLHEPTLRWVARLRSLNVSPGDVVLLKERAPIDTPMLVVARTISFKDQAIDQLSIEVEGISAQAARDDLLQRYDYGVPLRAVGEVIDIDDPKRLGRIKVRFPWHSKGAFGTWCRSLHPTAGVTHGTFNTPAVGEWVIAFHWPLSLDVPLILGATYHGGAKVQDAVSDQRSQRAVLMTQRGQRIVADEKADELVIGIYNGAQLACELSFKKSDASIRFSTGSGGQISMQADSINIEASGGLKIKGRVSIE
ncbi:hypothetical protein ACVMII_003893 [Bradyrhizobium diazoefficiens]